MTEPNRRGMEQLSVGMWKHTNIPTYAPPRDRGLPGSFSGKTRIQYNTTKGLIVTICNRDGISAADRWVEASPVDKCRSPDYGAILSRHSWSACFWHGRSPYICLIACTSKNAFFYTLRHTVYLLTNTHDKTNTNPPPHNGTGTGISATSGVSLTSTELSETYLTWFRTVQGPRFCNLLLHHVRRPPHMSRNTEF